MDISSAPIIADVTVDGKPRKVVAQPSKQGFLYVFDRVTGKPIWDFEERAVEMGTVPGEWYSPTQPFPTKPPAYSRNGISIDDLIDFTPAMREEAKKLITKYKIGPVFTPPVESKAEGPWATLVSSLSGSNWMGGSIDPEKRDEVRCRRCVQQPFTAARACGVYEGALRNSVLALKRQPYLPRRLVDLLADTSRRVPLQQSSRIIPVPLHPERESARGFNQALVMSRALSNSIGLPVDDTSLVRIAHSERYRAGLDAKGRQDTVENSFAIRYPRLIVGENILLVDDVFTTGATVSSCADVLLAAGAGQVFVLTIARPSW